MTTTAVPGAARAAGTSIAVHRAPTLKPKADESNLGFGVVFTDHMLVENYDEGQGWHDARIEPYHTFELDPAAAVLHYAQMVFDGLKAFRWADGSVHLFRPQKHIARLISSCERMCIPAKDPDATLEALLKLIDVERDWVPSPVGTALYVRPTVIATEAYLGVRPAKSYLYYVILSPVGAYFGHSMSPVRILVADRYVRAVEGGVGAAKTGGNYAASLYASEEAKHAGYDQVLWLDGREHKYLDEVGTMNVMLRIGDEVVTPALTGSILPGVTRDSVMMLLRDWGLKVSERLISIDEVAAAAREGTLLEAWGTGTAAVISPIAELSYQGQSIVVNDGKVGELTQRLYDSVLGIQYGTAPDTHNWLVTV